MDYGLKSRRTIGSRRVSGYLSSALFVGTFPEGNGLNRATTMETRIMRDDLGRDDLDNRTAPGMREDGMGMGTIAAIAAAVLIVGALFLWPRSDQSASNTAPGTTVGQTRTAPAPTMPSPAPSPAAPSTTK
jgi:hypothetical protein